MKHTLLFELLDYHHHHYYHIRMEDETGLDLLLLQSLELLEVSIFFSFSSEPNENERNE